jgi:HSP90 family molecular chaperone
MNKEKERDLCPDARLTGTFGIGFLSARFFKVG